MLKPTQIPDTDSANRFVKLWAARYLPNLSVLPLQAGGFPVDKIIEATSQTARAKTIKQVRPSLRFYCELAGFKTYALFSDYTIYLTPARHSAHIVEQIYEKAFEIYLRQPPLDDFLKFIDASSSLLSRLSLLDLAFPSVSQIAATLESSLLELQKHHLDFEDSVSISFLTTHFRFSSQKILEPLTTVEQVLLSPYLKFIEEQVCMPWQQICAAAATYPITSPIFILVEQIFVASSAVAEIVYCQASQWYPAHRSRRGTIDSSELAASTIRDLNMIQSYLCLCILEGNMASIEQELLMLCKAVLPRLGVKWKLIEYMLQRLVEEIQTRVDPEHLNLLLPYTQALQQLFAGIQTVFKA